MKSPWLQASWIIRVSEGRGWVSRAPEGGENKLTVNEFTGRIAISNFPENINFMVGRGWGK